MKAGRDLDALVAEKVMGHHLQRWINYPDREPLIMGPVKDAAIPHYSTQIADAWLVVEKMSEKWIGSSEGFAVEQEWTPLSLDKPSWTAGYWRNRGYPLSKEFYEPFCATADTAPLAICLASLRAVGVDIDEE